MDWFFSTIIVPVILLGILIFVHELGHFLVAKFFGVGVIEFALGFGRRIISRPYRNTRYSVRLIPLGGFVRMAGDDPRQVYGADKSVQPDKPDEQGEQDDAPEPDELERALQADRSLWFLEKGLGAKAAIVIAGPLGNMIFALVCAIFGAYIFGRIEPLDEPVIGGVVPQQAADRAGLKDEDRIVEVNGSAVDSWQQLADLVAESGGKELDLLVDRQGERLQVKVAGEPESPEMALLSGSDSKEKRYKIGIIASHKAERIPVSAFEAVTFGTLHVYEVTRITVIGFLGMVRGIISPRNLGGPIIILKEAARSVERGFEWVLNFLVFLSVSLAILNLLPVPVLDGGHLMFFAIEAIKGSPVNLRAQEWANQVGLLLLLCLMAFALTNDLWRLFEG